MNDDDLPEFYAPQPPSTVAQYRSLHESVRAKADEALIARAEDAERERDDAKAELALTLDTHRAVIGRVLHATAEARRMAYDGESTIRLVLGALEGPPDE